jgi:peptidoglycan/xylan/chitin deacetylase (PgdA/CDA1 family)
MSSSFREDDCLSRLVRALAPIIFLMGMVACQGPTDPMQTTPEPTQTLIATIARTETPTPTPTPSPTPTPTPEPTATPTPSPTSTPTPQPTPTPIPVAPAITVERANTTKKIVALTFDTGTDTGFAAQVLDLLKQQKIKATFGLTGRWAQQNPDLVKRMVSEGHQVINLTYDHQSFTGFSTGQSPLSKQQRVDELNQMRDIVLNLTKYDVKPYFRPPYGDVDGSVLQDIADAGYSVNVMWSIDTQSSNGATANEIVARVRDQVAPGAIILMQVGAQSQDFAALPRVIQNLRQAGYQFVTVKQMVGR